VLIIFGFVGLGAMVYLFRKAFVESANQPITSEGDIETKVLTLEPKRIGFENIKESVLKDIELVSPGKCNNDKLFYYVMESQPDAPYKSFVLPDTEPEDIYYSVEEMGNAVTMRQNKRYEDYAASSTQKVPLAIMAGVAVLLTIAIIAVE
jgi:hypothetical protein